jgi:hypothetical protein
MVPLEEHPLPSHALRICSSRAARADDNAKRRVPVRVALHRRCDPGRMIRVKRQPDS